MSFGSDLQGWQSHEALLGVQDYEINLLENVRKCMIHRAKCDREYIAALSSAIGTITQKLANSNYDTPTGQASFIHKYANGILMVIVRIVIRLLYGCRICGDHAILAC